MLSIVVRLYAFLNVSLMKQNAFVALQNTYTDVAAVASVTVERHILHSS